MQEVKLDIRLERDQRWEEPESIFGVWGLKAVKDSFGIEGCAKGKGGVLTL